ncbi:hypothetical protein HELRODRAFT_186784 [Helobdella robusta]|uniref:Uncharacterized protein n=1 Tax=Helobdella robusta TaxID=6412 RepID=T1FP35_HELRO|nr:hypothetical protein HELRODRAFT_186784 [Helobdella robusta]ESO08888.1 hypothetical protein HELRODRAFT_186784 [Helobdella robusta]
MADDKLSTAKISTKSKTDCTISSSTSSPMSGKKKPQRCKRLSLWEYLSYEVTRNYWLENDEAKFQERRKRVYSFIKIPKELEKFMIYGFFQCLDAFLFIFTFLPLRILKSFIKVFFKCCFRFSSNSGSSSRGLLDPAEKCDVLKLFVLLVCCLLMNLVDVSVMYHVIRGQTVIKLYIFFNMLDVADKLCSSFGQDILDSLFWTATERKSRVRDKILLIPHVALAIVYVFLHTILVLLQANTLNVAFNSHNKALLTIMMSNNFVELKASVFKKFEKNNLFQMSCSDVRERFHLLVLLLIVAIRNLAQFSWSLDHFWVLFPDMLLVMLCELLVDWVKHAFITKFNDISFDVYREYNVSLAYDIVGSRHPTAFSDHLDVVSRRMGFIPLPLAVLLVRIIMNSIQVRTFIDAVIIVIFFICLLTFKILTSIVLLGFAHKLIKENKDILLKTNLANTETTQQQQPQQPENVKSPSKDDIDVMKTTQEYGEIIEDMNSFRRSQSMGEFVEDNDMKLISSDNKTNIINNNINNNNNNNNHQNGDAEDDGDDDIGDEVDKELLKRKYSLNSPGSMLYNSTVSLDSVLENEVMKNDLQLIESLKQAINEEKGLNSSHINPNDVTLTANEIIADESFEGNKRKKSPHRKMDSTTADQQPLSEVDRYTMCCNRII